MQPVGPGQALQLDVAGLAERQVAPVLDDLAHERRHQDLTAPGLAGDAGGQHDRVPEEVTVLTIASPVCMPIRTRSRSAGCDRPWASRVRWTSMANSTADRALGKASMKPSPWAFTS